MVGVEVGEEHLVELVHGQLQARVVRERTAAEVDDEDVALCVADLDEDAAGGLGARDPGVAAAEHRHPDLAVLELLVAGHEHLGVLPPRRTDHGCRRDRPRAAGKRRHREWRSFAVRHRVVLSLSSAGFTRSVSRERSRSCSRIARRCAWSITSEPA
jgi:hypothetical protein